MGLAPDPVSIGDGLTFVMAAHDHTLGRSGGFYVIIMVSRDLWDFYLIVYRVWWNDATVLLLKGQTSPGSFLGLGYL